MLALNDLVGPSAGLLARIPYSIPFHMWIKVVLDLKNVEGYYNIFRSFYFYSKNGNSIHNTVLYFQESHFKQLYRNLDHFEGVVVPEVMAPS